MFYIYANEEWPNFTWDYAGLSSLFQRAAFSQGQLAGKISRLGLSQQRAEAVALATREICKSSEIEGVFLDMSQVRSSVAKRLSLHVPAPKKQDLAAAGAAEVALDATQNYSLAVTKKRLCAWHSLLFPTGFSGVEEIKVGAYRDDKRGKMRVISMHHNRECVHYEAPAAEILPKEMSRFLAWLNNRHDNDLAAAAIAHLWFLTLHPFEDGNGRIARALTELMLSRAEQSPLRFYGMSAAILRDKRRYYEILEKTQSGGLDVSPWMEWFLSTLIAAVATSESAICAALDKAAFWQNLRATDLDAAQRKIINRMLDGFAGKLTSSKWAKICKCSQDTAARAIRDLIDKKILRQEGAGRSTHYVLHRRLSRANEL
ncbi:MAG: Fic family protein [Opitutae bacterium]|nr:Fic family protein [Opitutae bacterium]